MTPLSSRRGLFAAAAFVILLGCQAETYGEGDLVFEPEELQIVGGASVSGGYVTFTAPWMAEVADRISLSIDDRPATIAVRADTGAPSEFLLSLPTDLPVGRHTLSYHRSSGGPIPVGSFHSGGFTELRVVKSPLYAPAQPILSLPGVVAMSPTGGGCGYRTMVLDARHATLSEIPNASTCGYGVGASDHPGSFTIYRPWSGGDWLRMGLSINGPVVDSLAMWGTHWTSHELAPGLFLKDYKQYTLLQGDTSVAYELPGSYQRPEYVAFSPDGALAVSSHLYSMNGLLIVDRQAKSHYWAQGWLNEGRALFLPDGRLIGYGGQGWVDGIGPERWFLGHIDLATGVTTDSVLVDTAGTWGGWFDLPTFLESAGWIVLARNTGERIEVTIRDPETLREIVRVPGPSIGTDCPYFGRFQVIEDPLLRRFYVIGTDCNYSTPILSFELPE